jgi:hypothetical protein
VRFYVLWDGCLRLESQERDAQGQDQEGHDEPVDTDFPVLGRTIFLHEPLKLYVQATHFASSFF